MTLLGKILLCLLQLVWDWVLLGVRVRTILTNDLPHAAEDRGEIRAIVDQQRTLLTDHLGFHRGLREAGKCPPEDSPAHPVPPSAPQ